jgi:hypothetical protein
MAMPVGSNISTWTWSSHLSLMVFAPTHSAASSVGCQDCTRDLLLPTGSNSRGISWRQNGRSGRAQDDGPDIWSTHARRFCNFSPSRAMSMAKAMMAVFADRCWRGHTTTYCLSMRAI